MKVYRTLGIGWGALCVFLSLRCGVFFQYSLSLSDDALTSDVCLFFCFGLLFLVGVVASAFLTRGITWARVTLCFIAISNVSCCGLALASGLPRLPVAFIASVGIYSLASIIMLLIPKRYVP